jgi:hypothetical protein
LSVEKQNRNVPLPLPQSDRCSWRSISIYSFAGIEAPPAMERTIDRMGDSGEGLVDASSRLQERMEEIQDSRRRTRLGESQLDPERIRALESLRLAKLDLERQLSMTTHEARRLHLVNALAEIDRRLSELQTAANQNTEQSRFKR